MKVLITGITGALGKMVAELLTARGHTVLGLDRRPWPDAPAGITMFQADIRKRPAEEVFRVHRPDVLIHMATVTHFSAPHEERYQTNLGGTRRLFDYCETYGVKQAVFVGGTPSMARRPTRRSITPSRIRRWAAQPSPTSPTLWPPTSTQPRRSGGCRR